MRTPRFEQIYDGCLVHMTTRCHEGAFFLRTHEAKRKYLELLGRFKGRYGVKVHGYTIMDNHVHLLCRVDKAVAFSRMLMAVHSSFVGWYNDAFDHTYGIFTRRPSTTVIEDNEHLFEAMRYIDLNCWRTKNRICPDDWKFSSYQYYANGTTDPLIDPCPIYEELAAVPDERRSAYRELVADMMVDDSRQKSIKKALGEWSYYFGTAEYMSEERKKLSDRVRQHKENRPKGRQEWPPAWNSGFSEKE